MNPSFLVLLSFIVGGGSGDLLDYVPTQGYWNDRGIVVTTDAMLHEAGPARRRILRRSSPIWGLLIRMFVMRRRSRFYGLGCRRFRSFARPPTALIRK